MKVVKAHWKCFHTSKWWLSKMQDFLSYWHPLNVLKQLWTLKWKPENTYFKLIILASSCITVKENHAKKYEVTGGWERGTSDIQHFKYPPLISETFKVVFQQSAEQRQHWLARAFWTCFTSCPKRQSWVAESLRCEWSRMLSGERTEDCIVEGWRAT